MYHIVLQAIAPAEGKAGHEPTPALRRDRWLTYVINQAEHANNHIVPKHASTVGRKHPQPAWHTIATVSCEGLPDKDEGYARYPGKVPRLALHSVRAGVATVRTHAHWQVQRLRNWSCTDVAAARPATGLALSPVTILLLRRFRVRLLHDRVSNGRVLSSDTAMRSESRRLPAQMLFQPANSSNFATHHVVLRSL